ncbi:ATP-binding protein [Burkholderia gladioli]|uniref:ATP-binding protein n=1 Tax=Burkholderia gladioli TaxID=28095 RepID=UPI00163F8C3C|nr:YhaN family protein [Burkholderia gladioli]
MRIRQLDLFKYGKFTEATLRFPAAAQDFHVIVGPNEAGKSTVRTAVSELLFGMKQRTPLDFLHDTPELRLGGLLDHAGGALAFHRARGRTSLRTPEDGKLPDDHLDAVLDGATREFFEQMFGLDHERLVAGGRSLLDASDRLGQVLFESAAGVGSLGPVREELEALRAGLWAPRATRTSFALAEADFSAASSELKAVLVRTRDWTERQDVLDAVRREIAGADERRRQVDRLRSTLERVRRLAPYLHGWREKAAQLAELGGVVELPSSATADLLAAREKLAVGAKGLEFHREDLARRQAAREAIVADPEALKFAAEIDALAALSASCAAHEKALPGVEAARRQHLDAAAAAAGQLGWPREEAGLRAALPSALALKTVSNLLRRQGGLAQALAGARDALDERERALDRLRKQREAIVVEAVPDALRLALAEAQAHRHGEAKERAQEQARAEAGHALDEALDRLGRWRMPVAQLRTLDLPSAQRLNACQKADSEAASAAAMARGALGEARERFEKLALQEQHFAQGNHVVTSSEVRAAREQRDQAWGEVKRGALALPDGAAAVDDAIRHADVLVDSQLDTVQAAAELQSLRQQREAAQAELARREADLAEATRSLDATRQAWADLAAGAGLPGIALDDIGAWLAQRDAALAAQQKLDALARELEAARAERSHAQQALVTALLSVAPATEADSLGKWIMSAEAFVQAAERAAEQRRGHDERVAEAGHQREAAAAQAERAQREHEDWLREWRTALADARLAEVASTDAAAQGAVDLANEVVAELAAAEEPARRIEAMRAELAARDADARRLADALEDPAVREAGEGAAISRALAARLDGARKTAEAITRADEATAQAAREFEAAQATLATEQARIAPLLASAGAATIDEALPLAARSDQQRRLREEIEAAQAALLRDGDGLSQDEIAAEIDRHDLAEVPAQLEAARREQDGLNAAASELVRRELEARQALAAIAGQSSAALAEARRQEALAAMGDTAEQYIEAATASRLLRWAIDRYRDQKQGPMLSRAGEIFAGLTLGEFLRLTVDTERQPPELSARRASGRSVEVGGLSEGTRDQLFLALRIAALELQLAHKAALPFVADDLFINFDDARSKAGLEALRELSSRTQVLFLTHHDHLLPLVREVFGAGVNVVELQRERV